MSEMSTEVRPQTKMELMTAAVKFFKDDAKVAALQVALQEGLELEEDFWSCDQEIFAVIVAVNKWEQENAWHIQNPS
jgi:hypothetical protein